MDELAKDNLVEAIWCKNGSKKEKNNVEDIKKRNIIKIVDYEKFSSQNPVFYQKLNNPDFILEALDNSGVLKYGKQNLYSLVQEKQNF